MYKVVIIDDNRLLADSLAKLDLWETLGCQVEQVCYDSVTGEKAIGDVKPDIIFTDIKLPGKDGLELISEILSDLPNVKVVCMSAYDDFSYSRRALQLKCEDYLLKPFSQNEIYDVLKKLVDTLSEKPSNNPAVEKNLDAMDNPLVRPIIQFILNNMEKGVTAEEVADEFHMSSAKLNKMILQTCNKGFRELRLELCMNRAKELLLDVRYSVDEVAIQVGYTNYYSFYRAFIRECGIAPTDFRNTHSNISSYNTEA